MTGAERPRGHRDGSAPDRSGPRAVIVARASLRKGAATAATAPRRGGQSRGARARTTAAGSADGGPIGAMTGVVTPLPV